MLVGLTTALLLGLGSPGAPAHSDHDVVIEDDTFVPDRLEIRPGEVVEWKNEGEQPHSVTSDDGEFDSGSLQPGQEFELRLDIPGTYRYHSVGGEDEMRGVVEVLPAESDGSGDSGPGSDSRAEEPPDGSAGTPGQPPTTDQEGSEAAQADAGPPESSSEARTSSGAIVVGQVAEVSIKDDAFVPRRIEIDAGGTVVWQHVGQRSHTVTASDGSFDSGTLESGASFSQTVDQSGTYSYYCRFHGTAAGEGMAGVFVVQGGATGDEPTGETDGTTPSGETGGLAATGNSIISPLAASAALLGAGLWILRLTRRKAAGR
jgi:plastocyanin